MYHDVQWVMAHLEAAPVATQLAVGSVVTTDLTFAVAEDTPEQNIRQKII